MQVPQQYVPDIVAAAQQYGVPAGILAAQLDAESGFDPRAQSPAGAQGIAQFMPGTAAEYHVDPWDPHSAIFGQAHYLSDLYKRFGDWTRALEAYNVGPGGPLEAARSYAEGILNRAKGLSPTLPGSGPSSSAAASPGRCTPQGWQAARCGAIDPGCALGNAWGAFSCSLGNAFRRAAAGAQIWIGLVVVGGGVAVLAYVFLTETDAGRDLVGQAKSAAKAAAVAAI